MSPFTQHALYGEGFQHKDRVKRIAARGDYPVRELPAEPGDVLVHNVHMIHESKPNGGEGPRRVIYFEFRTLDQAQFDSPWPQASIEGRLSSWERAAACINVS